MDTTTHIFETEREGDTIILIPIHDLSELEFAEIESAASSLLEWIELAQVKHVVIDFCKTDYFGSTALGFFTKMWKRVKSGAGRMALCNLSEHERDILKVTHLDKLWPIYNSRQKAVETVRNM